MSSQKGVEHVKALIFEAPWSMPLRDLPEPEAGIREVIVEVRAVGICGSDVHGFTGSTGRRKPGIVMGHEFAGTIQTIGEDVTGFGVGDRVVVNPLVTCGTCQACRNGRENICENRLGIGWSVDGAFAERVRVPERNLRRIPSTLEWPLASLVEPLAVALRAANLTPFALGDTVVVLGAGPIGLLCVLALRLKGAGTVIVSDLSPHRLELALRMGADHAINAQERDPVSRVRELTGGRGAQAVLEAVGVSATVEQSARMAQNGGAITWVGNAAPSVTVPMQEIVTRELTVRGSYGFGSEFDRALEILAAGRVDLRPLIEHVAPLQDGERLITALAKAQLEAVKVILEP